MTRPISEHYQNRRRSSLPKLGFRGKLLTLLLATTAGATLIIAWFAVQSIDSAGKDAIEQSTRHLEEQCRDYLLRLTTEQAIEHEAFLTKVASLAEISADCASSLYAARQDLDPTTYWTREKTIKQLKSGATSNDESDTASMFLTSAETYTSSIAKEFKLLAHLDFLFRPIVERTQQVAAVYINTRSGITRYFPNINLATLLPEGYDARTDVFYQVATPTNNPQKNVVWTPIYDDPAGNGLMVSAVAPIYSRDEAFLGSIGIDVTLTGLIRQIEGTNPLPGGYSILLDEQDRIVAMPKGARAFFPGGLLPVEGIAVERFRIGSRLTRFLSQDRSIPNRVTIQELNGVSVLAAVSELPESKWKLINLVERELVLDAVDHLTKSLRTSTSSLTDKIVWFGLGILAVVFSLGFFLVRRFVRPITRLATAARAVCGGDWEIQLPKAGNDEIGILTTSFGQMREGLRKSIEELEVRVVERTTELHLAKTQAETLHAISEASNNSSSTQAVLVDCIQSLIEGSPIDLVCIHFAGPGSEPQTKLEENLWVGEAAHAQVFDSLSTTNRLIESAVESRLPQSVDMSRDPSERTQLALKLGYSGVSALPVTNNSETLAVLELFASSKAPSEDLDSHFLSEVTFILSRVFERDMNESQRNRLHNDLINASRRAGMAEVATSVLHNVGNVLNSVHVSTNVLHEQLASSRINSLTHAVELITEHSEDLSDYLTNDERGQRLPEYIGLISARITAEHTRMQEEVEALCTHSQHLQRVIAMQQSLTDVSGLAQKIAPCELYEEVLVLSASELNGVDVQILCETTSSSNDLITDRSMLCRILDNLIRNAAQACRDSNPPTIVLATSEADGMIIFSVQDNGSGIHHEELSTIFACGFTTKQDGNGFGLHHSANAATELGGHLDVSSEGPGKGATFYLRIPLQVRSTQPQ